jgi:hypothetical protein
VLETGARITIARKHEKDIKDRQIVVSLDGENVGTLMFGDSVTKTVEPGSHRLRAHNTLFWKTRHVELAPGEHARFIVVNRPGPGTYSLLGVLGVGLLYLTFERTSD